MRIALLEMRRQPSKFAAATLILTLVAVLLMFLGGLLDGLIRNSTGAIEALETEAIVFSESSQASLLRSRVEPSTRTAIESGLDADVGGLGVVQLGARVPGNGPRDLANVAVWGYQTSVSGVPSPPASGSAWADENLKVDGVQVGDELLLGPSRTPIVVAGWVSSASYNGQASLWVDADTWRMVLNENRPDGALTEGVFQALTVSMPGTMTATEVAETVQNLAGAGFIALTVPEAIDAIPGVTQQRNTFNQILGVTVLIALVVIGLFFALLTVERTGLYAVLKAVGAKSSTIFMGLVVQSVVLTAVAAAVASVAVIAIDAAIPPGSIPLFVSPQRLIMSAGQLVAAAVLGCAFSLRRILRIDPATALGGA